MLTGQGESDSLERLAHIGNERNEISVNLWSFGYQMCVAIRFQVEGEGFIIRIQITIAISSLQVPTLVCYLDLCTYTLRLTSCFPIRHLARMTLIV